MNRSFIAILLIFSLALANPLRDGDNLGQGIDGNHLGQNNPDSGLGGGQTLGNQGLGNGPNSLGQQNPNDSFGQRFN